MKRIIIVGASSGLGRLIAQLCANEGWKVGVAARNLTALNELVEKYPNQMESMEIDITHDDAPDLLRCLVDRIGGMDIYLHVSGILCENSGLNLTDEMRTVETNVGGFTRMIATAYSWFKDKAIPGHIAAITSVAGTKGIGDLASYSASKRYQWTYLEALEQLARKDGVKICFTDIRPGWTKTPLIDPNKKYMLAMEADTVARKAFKALKKQKRVAYIDTRWGILSFLWRLLPSWIWTRLPVSASQ